MSIDNSLSAYVPFKNKHVLNLIRGRECLDAKLQFERTALICAFANGHADCVRLLLEAGADMENKDNMRV